MENKVVRHQLIKHAFSRNQRSQFLNLVEHHLQIRRCWVLPTCQVHVLHGFVRIPIWGSCISFHRTPRRTNNSQGARATSDSFVTTSPNCAAVRMKPAYHRATLHETLFESKRLKASCPSNQKASWTPRQPPPEQREFVVLPFAIFCKSSCPNRCSFKHNRMQTTSSSPAAA